jgi:hypothetical protein
MAKKINLYSVEIDFDTYKKLDGVTLFKVYPSKKWVNSEEFTNLIFQLFAGKLGVWYWGNNVPHDANNAAIHAAPLASEIDEAIASSI